MMSISILFVYQIFLVHSANHIIHLHVMVITLAPSEIEKNMLRISRILYKSCKTTHALLPTFIIPYSQIDSCTILSILTNNNQHSILADHPYLEESHLHYLQKQYKTLYKPYLPKLPTMDIAAIIKQCFITVFRMFMQVVERHILHVILET